MLYKIEDDFTKIEPIKFLDFSDIGKNEKDLENLIAYNLLTTLFEDGSLMPIFQERQLQPEADIYALDSCGNLIIFELKRSLVGKDALYQVLGYAQTAGKWSYSKLEKKYQQYEKPKQSLKEAHKEAYDLEEPLLEKEFNQNQQLLIVGSAADNNLIEAVTYWKNRGVDIDFLPYRLYKMALSENSSYCVIIYDKFQLWYCPCRTAPKTAFLPA